MEIPGQKIMHGFHRDIGILKGTNSVVVGWVVAVIVKVLGGGVRRTGRGPGEGLVVAGLPYSSVHARISHSSRRRMKSLILRM